MAELLLPGERRRKGQRRQVLTLAVIAGLAGGGYWYWTKGKTMSLMTPTPERVVTLAEPELPPVAPEAKPLPAPTGVTPQTAAPAGTTPPLAPPMEGGLRAMSVTIDGPLERAIVAGAGREMGPALAQVITRTLVWWVDVPQDLLRNDVLQVVYEPQTTGEPLVHAVSFQSHKTGQTHKAYRFKHDGSAFPRYYQPTGEELEMRLQPSPLDDYEQVTSLIRDGRRHKGVDFKTAVGTPVRATFNGTLTRRNWNFRGNGNCLELTENGTGRKVLYLHLDVLPASSVVGKRVNVGDVIANSGNSGHSFAPHLHYQLEAANERVLDPFTVHKPYRRTIPDQHKPALATEVSRLDGLLQKALTAR
jgi:murein DD-endopeptidase